MSQALAQTPNAGGRIGDLQRLYDLLDAVAAGSGGPRRLGECTGRMSWPERGVYFFFEPGEERSDSGIGPRVVRVGTHALKTGSKATLWNRLSAHRGTERTKGGNHRGSIFRLLVGAALMGNGEGGPSRWGQGSSAPRDVRDGEREMEARVSEVLGRFAVLCLEVDDPANPASLRGLIEQNAIALLSNTGKAPIDPPSAGWLGARCPRDRVQSSGLWNQNHVDETYDPAFFDAFERCLRTMEMNR